MGEIYILTEGAENSTQHTLWNLINNYLYNNELNIIACGSASRIPYELNNIINNTDIFIIDIDTVANNSNLVNIYTKINSIKTKNNNIESLKLLCLEDTLLNFKYLENWIFEIKFRDKQPYKDKITILNSYIKDKNNWIHNKELRLLMTKIYGNNISNKTIEKLAFHVLIYITSRSAFNTNKSTLGYCFSSNCKNKICCQYYKIKQHNKIENNICRLFNNKKTDYEKIKQLYKYTQINSKMEIVKQSLLNKHYTEAANIVIL